MAAAAMPPALTLPDWQSAAKHVEQLASATAAFGSASYGWLALPPMTNATWRKMMAKKVPQQLASACARVLHNTLLSSSGSSNGSGSSAGGSSSTASAAAHTALSMPCAAAAAAAAAVLDALEMLTRRAFIDLLLEALQLQPKHKPASAEATAFRQQIEQSGFLQLLPQLCASLAERVQAATGLSTHLKPASQPPAATGSSSTSSTRMDRQQRDTAFMLTAATTAALRTFALLADAWPTDVFVTEVAPGCTAAVLQLCWLSFQQVSTKLPPPGTAPSTQLLGTVSEQWGAAAAAAQAVLTPFAVGYTGLAASVQHTRAQQKACVLASSGALPCLAFLLTVGVYGMLLAQLPMLPRLRAAACCGSTHTSAGAASGNSRGCGSSSSSSSSSGRVSSGLSGPAAAWELACKQLANVPSAHSMMLQQLGCSPLAALFCGALHGKTGYSAAATGLQQPGSSTARVDAEAESAIERMHLSNVCVYIRWASAALTPVAPDPKPSAEASANSTAERQLHLLLSPVLFYWAAHQPACLGGGAPADCSAAVLGGLQALMVAKSNPVKEGFAVPDWLLQLVRAEVTPLISVVAASVLGSLGCTSTPGSTASTSGSIRSSSKPRKRATATSTTPSQTAMELAAASSQLAASEQLPMLCVQLLEAAVRGWQPSGLTGSTHFLVEVRQVLMRLMKSSCSSSTNRLMPALSGPLIAAAQVQGHTTGCDPLSPEQLQLASLCCSVLKVLSAACEAYPSLHDASTVLECCQLVADGAGSMLRWLAAAAKPAAGSSSTQHAVAAAVPWLVLSGRVLQFVAPPAIPQRAAGLQQFFSNSLSSHSYWLQRSAHTAIAGLRVWLQTEGAAEGLSAAGYDPSGSVLQQLQAACGASSIFQLPEPETLQSLSRALSTLPFACACNNPACNNLTGPRELQLVDGKSCMCGGCRVAHYCSRACQKQHWPAHRPVCKATAAARQGTGAAVAIANEAAQTPAA